MSSSGLSLIVIALLITGTYADCYLRNGTSRNLGWAQSDRYSSCDPYAGGASMCCSQNYGGDVCVSIGRKALALCYNQGQDNLWRESCTDQTWSSINCVKLFTNVSDTDVSITNCSAGGYGEGFCYGHKNYGCCNAGMAVFIDPDTGEQVATNPRLKIANSSATSSTASASTLVSTSPSSPPSTSAPASNNPDTGLSGSALHGLIAGVVIAVALLVVVCGFLLYRRVKKRRATNAYHNPIISEIGSTDTKSKPHPPLEMPATTYPHWNGRSELQDGRQEKQGSTGELATAVQDQFVRRKPLSAAGEKTAVTAELSA